MALKQQLRDELDRLVGHVSEQAPAELQLAIPAGRVDCRLTAVDQLGCSFEHLTVTTDRLAQATSAELKELCEKLSRRLNYLLEPIRPVEVDQEHCMVQMRSHPPQKDLDGTTYYELVAQRGGQIRLCRYHKQRGQVRRVIAATVTREVLGRLASDLAEAVA